jgi:hypothetical protein
LNYNKYDFPIAELNPYWGVWHYTNSVYTEKRDCIECTYHINSYGARDKERIKEADTNRIIMLRDSFIEGYGMSEEERLSDRLEKQLGIAVNANTRYTVFVSASNTVTVRFSNYSSGVVDPASGIFRVSVLKY